MEPLEIIQKYYTPGTELYNILVDHSRLVTARALEIASAHPELGADLSFIAEAGMIHDIGIYLTDAPDIACLGSRPYICHGVLGSELMKKEGYPCHALVCERHTGTGLSLDDIIRQGLPLPYRDMLPVSIEEQIICFADKFYSKSHPNAEKNIGKMRKSIAKYGDASVARFEDWCTRFSL